MRGLQASRAPECLSLGRQRLSAQGRLALCKVFIAKATWDFATTRDLIDAVRHRPALRRLCGWQTIGEIPSEFTFSCAFAAFAEDQLPQRIHDAMITMRLLSGSADGTAKLWDLASERCLQTLSGHEGYVQSVAYYPDSAFILTDSNDCTAKLWRAATGECVRTYVGHTDIVNSSAFSPNGALVVTASSDNTAKLWNTATTTA